MPKGRVIKIRCQCGQLLFKYYKGGRGRLIKCYLDEIREDHVGIVDADAGRELASPPHPERPTCPGCGKELGIIRMVRGRPALKINQGAVQVARI
jgi:hypothetical protein